MGTEKNEVAQKSSFTTALSNYMNTFTGLVENDFSQCGLQLNDYEKQCAMNAVNAIYDLVTNTDKADMKDISTSNLRQIVGQCASLNLNASAKPRECYFQLRAKKQGDQWVKVVEMGIEGDGNDALLRNFGQDVKKVYPCWKVKEGDVFTYPKRKGLEVQPPEWEEHGESEKIVRIVYPLLLNSGEVEYLISERESVKVNLIAHIRQNLMNETFGLLSGKNSKGKDKTIYDATPAEKEKIKAMKSEVLKKARSFQSVDDIIACEELAPYMSPAWLDTPEAMIERKMRNNATKKYPKNFNVMAMQAVESMDDTYEVVQEEVEENQGKQEFIEADSVEQTEEFE